MDINAEKKFAAGLSITSNALIIATKIVPNRINVNAILSKFAITLFPKIVKNIHSKKPKDRGL